MTSEGPIGNLLHLLIFVAGAAVIGVVALGVIERLAGGGTPRIRARQIAIAFGVLAATIAVEVAFHFLGRS